MVKGLIVAAVVFLIATFPATWGRRGKRCPESLRPVVAPTGVAFWDSARIASAVSSRPSLRPAYRASRTARAETSFTRAFSARSVAVGRTRGGALRTAMPHPGFAGE